jgi:hypothetical protein
MAIERSVGTSIFAYDIDAMTRQQALSSQIPGRQGRLFEPRPESTPEIVPESRAKTVFDACGTCVREEKHEVPEAPPGDVNDLAGDNSLMSEPATSTRIALPWDQPFLPQVAAWLCAQNGDDRRDFRRWTLVTTGGRAGRRLLAELVTRNDGVILPPTITTPGRLFHDDFQMERLLATPDDLRMAWIESLRELRPRDRQVIAGCLGRDDARLAAVFADAFIALDRDLAAVEHTMDELPAIIARHDDGGRIRAEALRARWTLIVERHADVIGRLHAAGLEHPALAMRDAPLDDASSSTSLVLVGVTELFPWHRRHLCARAASVTALIHAPSDFLHTFDEFGALDVDSWHDVAPPVRDEQLVVVDQPADQAGAMLDVIRELSATHSSDQITIGVADESMTNRLVTHAGWAEVALHTAEGRPLADTRPVRLLNAIADWVDEPRFTTFATLLRHPDLLSWLSRTVDDATDTYSAASRWISLLDVYYGEHLDGRLDGHWLGAGDEQRALREVYGHVTGILRHLLVPGRAPLRDWCARTLEVLGTMYANVTDDTSASRVREEDACLAVRSVLVRLATAPASIQPELTSAAGLRLIVSALHDATLAENADDAAIEALGWLELHHDSAPALVIVGVNDGSIPAIGRDDPLLPEPVRRALGLPGERERVARDAYVLTAILHSRPHVTLIAGRRTGAGDSLLPSRLLLRGEGRERAKRILRFTVSDQNSAPRIPLIAPSAAESRFTIPELPAGIALPEKISVTAFRTLLQCPYRFVLQYIYRLDAPRDDERELSGLHFGNLAHDVFRLVGETPDIPDSADADLVRTFVLDNMQRIARSRFGAKPQPAVRLQLARLTQRLEQFARWQASQRAAGWIIQYTEHRLDEQSALSPTNADDLSVGISGIIDRIDRHEDSGEYRILDYKTGDAGTSPDDAHGNAKRGWSELQLPLYRHFALAHLLEGPVTVGYVVVPRQTEGVKAVMAHWSEGDFADAVRVARDALQRLVDGEYTKPARGVGAFDDFARICQTTTMFLDRAEDAATNADDPEALDGVEAGAGGAA